MNWITIEPKTATNDTPLYVAGMYWNNAMLDLQECEQRLDRMGYTHRMDYTGAAVWVKQTGTHQLLLLELAFSDYIVTSRGPGGPAY